MFAIMETALVFFAGQTLEAAVANSAPLIMTGQAQTAGFSQADSRPQVCTNFVGAVRLRERRLCQRQDLFELLLRSTTTPPVTNGQLDTTKMSYHAGRPGRHRRGAALLPMADLRLAARRQPCQHERRQPPAGGDRRYSATSPIEGGGSC